MIQATEFRDAMALLPAAVNVVTTTGNTGQHGFTASAVCSVTDTPPTLLVCMNQASRSYPHFAENQVLCVNVLGAQHQALADAFASRLPSEARFAQGEWTQLVTGSPVLTDSQVSFDCHIVQINTVGTHSIFVCQVAAIHQQAPDYGLVYFNRGYHHVGTAKAPTPQP